MFDPYQVWLGIPQSQRPPTYYQLLGIAAAETDRRAIEEAAIRRMSQIRIYQAGPYERECIQLLNEIAQAETTLLHPAKRQAYNAQLAQMVTAQRDSQRAAPRPKPACPFPALERRFTFPPEPVDAGVSPFAGLGEPESIIEFRAPARADRPRPPALAPWESAPTPEQGDAEGPANLFRFGEEGKRRRRSYTRHYWPDALVVLYLGFMILAGVVGFCFAK
jgi:hypothetical protein